MLPYESTGTYEQLIAKRDAGLACVRDPRAKARILGVPYRLPTAKEHRIIVDCRTGKRSVETLTIDPPVLKAYRAPVVRRIPPAVKLSLGQRIAEAQRRRLMKKIGMEPDLAITTEAILQAVTTAFDMSPYALLGANRTQRVARPRWAAMKLMRTLSCMSTSIIGKTLGGRDHTSIMYGLLRAEELLEADLDWRARYDHALTLLGKQPQ